MASVVYLVGSPGEHPGTCSPPPPPHDEMMFGLLFLLFKFPNHLFFPNFSVLVPTTCYNASDQFPVFSLLSITDTSNNCRAISVFLDRTPILRLRVDGNNESTVPCGTVCR